MILQSALKARLVTYPEVEVEKTKEKKKIGKFTVGKRYRVISIFDNGQGFTDFLIADDDGFFHWINMSVFRSK